MKKFPPTQRTKLKRLPQRAAYDEETIFGILDDTFLCHVSFNFAGQVYIIPTVYGRRGEYIYIHGSNKSRMLKALNDGADICISVTHLDGLVLARSAFHHSVNYRSVVIFAKPQEITDEKLKKDALEVIMEHIIPGRWDEIRKPTQKELRMTSVYAFKLSEVSAKIRTGPPSDDTEDLELNVWAGVLPLKTIAGKPLNDTYLNNGIKLPDYINTYKK